MTAPEQALEQARAAAAQMRSAGAYEDPAHSEPLASEGVEVSEEQLVQWAVLEPDAGSVRSMRRFGAPITTLKRILVRLLAQYHQELTGEQTRFNLVVIEQLRRLERRVAELEQRLQGGGGE